MSRETRSTTARFLLTPLREGRPRQNWMSLSRTTFLLTPLREGRPLPDKEFDLAVVISTHAPAGGATEGELAPQRLRGHFYSRPCGRGDVHRYPDYGMADDISTHAPAGGATRMARSL